MIVLDTSALVAILLGEAEAEACAERMIGAEAIHISTANLTEMLIVAAGRQLLKEAQAALAALDPVLEPLSPMRAEAAARAYQTWGRGFHKAALNYGDCFAYALAKELGCSLLFVGEDFARTDIPSALG